MDGLLITCVSYATLQCIHLRQHTVRKSIGLHFVFSACAERFAFHAYARTSSRPLHFYFLAVSLWHAKALQQQAANLLNVFELTTQPHLLGQPALVSDICSMRPHMLCSAVASHAAGPPRACPWTQPCTPPCMFPAGEQAPGAANHGRAGAVLGAALRLDGARHLRLPAVALHIVGRARPCTKIRDYGFWV